MNQHTADKLIAALLTEPTIRDAAKKIGIAEITAFRYLRKPAFRNRLREARRQVVDAAICRLTSISDKAVATLERALDSGSPAVELRAAMGVLSQIREYIGSEDTEQQIADLTAEVERLREARQAAMGWSNN